MISTMPARRKPLRGGARVGAGRKSAFPDKIIDRPFPMDFTPAGRVELEKITKRTGLSRNDVIAHLAIKHAGLKFSADGVAYPGKAQNVLSIRVPAYVGTILRTIHRRTGKSYSDIGEALVRQFGRVERAFPKRPSANGRV